MTVGFIGTGKITSALVAGLCTAEKPPQQVLVSPRNAQKAATLAARFSQVSVAVDNQNVVDGCDCVFLAVLPQIARAVLKDLRFRSDQTVISMVPTVAVDEVKTLATPAIRIARAVPLPTVTHHLGPIAMYPEVTQAVEIFAKVGKPLPVDSEHELNMMWTVTALIAPFYAWMEETCRWASANGVNRRIAAAFIASMFHALSAITADSPDPAFADLIAEAATPGGFNEQALSEIRKQGGYRILLNALDSVRARHGGNGMR